MKHFLVSIVVIAFFLGLYWAFGAFIASDIYWVQHSLDWKTGNGLIGWPYFVRGVLFIFALVIAFAGMLLGFEIASS
jgi:hypothetical protein